MAETKATTPIEAAFLRAYAAIQNPKKNAENPAFKSKYANLEEMLAVTRPVLVENALMLVQSPVSDENGVGVRTQIVDGRGEWLDFGSFTVPLAKRDAQGAGSAITYCRRYSIAAVFGLAQEDDDGNEASTRTAKADPLKAEFDNLILVATNNNTGAAVKAKWDEFGDMPHDLDGYHRLAEDARSELLSVAGGVS